LPKESDQERQTALLRLASARQRLRAIIDEIGTLEGSDFPHPDAEAALEDIKTHFSNLLGLTTDGSSLSVRTIRQLCMDVAVQSELYLPVLGFLLRSTNVRNAFELYDPLRAIVSEAISSDARLVISSEWDFIPFTYPMNLDVLPKYVLVGGPASESSNPLVIPLAGHEIGHSAWRQHDIASSIEAEFTAALEDVAKLNADIANELEQDYGSDYIGFLRDVGFKQLEEIFCDCFGLYLFGESYAFAYEYFMFPGGAERSLDYPAEEDRIDYLRQAAQKRGIILSADLFTGWKPSSDAPDCDPNIDAIVDGASRRMLPTLFSAVDGLLSRSGVPTPSPDAAGRIAESYKRSIPNPEGGNLADIVTAGWHCLREASSVGEDSHAVTLHLSELMLKSIEVAEYQKRVGVC
jgi:hypothetical protein